MAPRSKAGSSRSGTRKPGKPVVRAKGAESSPAKLRRRRKPRGSEAPFWEAVPLAEMTREQWEQLCDGCGQCCMLKVEDEDTAQVFITRLACKLLDIGSCRCGSYPDRHDFVPDCVVLQPETVGTYAWLPRTCAYRLLAEGKPLQWWHPLVSGDPETVHQAGISVRTWARSEKGVKASAITRYIIEEV